MQQLLIAGPDSTLPDAYELAKEIWPDRKLVKLHIPSKDYYYFDLSILDDYPADEWNIALIVNEFYINDVRRALQEEIKDRGYCFTSLISPRASISASAQLGNNSIVHAGCFVGAHSKLGDFCWLRPNTVISEEVQMGSFITLEANVSIREQSIIEDFVTVCAGSSLLRGTQIGRHSYLNITKQYSGIIPAGTFFSPMFQEPVQVLGLHRVPE